VFRWSLVKKKVSGQQWLNKQKVCWRDILTFLHCLKSNSWFKTWSPISPWLWYKQMQSYSASPPPLVLTYAPKTTSQTVTSDKTHTTATDYNYLNDFLTSTSVMRLNHGCMASPRRASWPSVSACRCRVVRWHGWFTICAALSRSRHLLPSVCCRVAHVPQLGSVSQHRVTWHPEPHRFIRGRYSRLSDACRRFDSVVSYAIRYCIFALDYVNFFCVGIIGVATLRLPASHMIKLVWVVLP
jgi:hypothetical protein